MTEKSVSLLESQVKNIFDNDYYSAQLTDPVGPEVDLLSQYLSIGWKQHLNPSVYFNVAWYLKHNPDVEKAGIEPLSHYLQDGWKQYRNPSPYFNVAWYLLQNSDVAKAGIEPLTHYLSHGWKERRNPSEYFNILSYLDQNAELYEIMDEPLKHYITEGWKKGYSPNPFFDVKWYLDESPDVVASGEEPLFHYIETGWKEKRNPNKNFDVTWYLENYSDVETARIEPLSHYLLYGQKEKRSPVPLTTQFAAAKFIINSMVSHKSIADPAEAKKPKFLLSAKHIIQQFSTLLIQEQFILSISHDNYLSNLGGVQLALGDEQKSYNDQGIDYIHLYPTSKIQTILFKNDSFYLGISCNGVDIGYCDPDTIIEALKPISEKLYNINIHHMLGFDIHLLKRILNEIGNNTGRFWLHDYFSLCPGVNLLRNNISFCGAPDLDSNACNICVFGELRRKHLHEICDLFSSNDLEVISPSRYTMDLWTSKFPVPAKKTIVSPHASIRWGKTLPPKKPNAPIRVAYPGFPVYHKGWSTWLELVRRFSRDKRYQFVHFSSSFNSNYGSFEKCQVEVNQENRMAMVEALRANEIDVAFVWSLTPETFCYSFYEALASGCYILGHNDSGNVQDFLKQNSDYGMVLKDEETLFRLFKGDGIVKSVSRFQTNGRPNGQLFFQSYS